MYDNVTFKGAAGRLTEPPAGPTSPASPTSSASPWLHQPPARYSSTPPYPPSTRPPRGALQDPHINIDMWALTLLLL
ncbi:unnamed protein product [Gadus morhua 'NCC']